MSEAAQQDAPQITITDLQNILQVIDVAATRGAFRGNELSSVGSVRDKLSTFLEAVAPKEEEAPADDQAG